MTQSTEKRALLPNGFMDLLPPYAGSEADAVGRILKSFAQFGYHRVKPPLLEFEDSLFSAGSPGAKLKDDTFRLMDPVSHKMMGIRSDITAQIARIATTRLGGMDRPLRLAYANDVLRIKASQQRIARQFCQVGCELIGDDNSDMDIEISVVAISALSKLGVQDLTVDLTLPQFVGQIVSAAGLSKDDEQAVYKAVKDRDGGALKTIHTDIAAIFDVLLYADHTDRLFNTLAQVDLPASAVGDIERLKHVYVGLNNALLEMGIDDVNLRIDLMESKGYDYHTGIGLGFYSAHSDAVLGRGGRYDIGDNADQQSAIGVTFYMDSVISALPAQKPALIVYVDIDAGWSIIAKLQNEGWRVMRGVDTSNIPHDCTHIYRNGAVEEL